MRRVLAGVEIARALRGNTEFPFIFLGLESIKVFGLAAIATHS